jgi:hypothetical protein
MYNVENLFFGVVSFIILFLYIVFPGGDDPEVGPDFGVEKVSKAVGEIRGTIAVA